MDARLGFEPRLKASKASVLPLDDRAMLIRCYYNSLLIFFQNKILIQLSRFAISKECFNDFVATFLQKR